MKNAIPLSLLAVLLLAGCASPTPPPTEVPIEAEVPVDPAPDAPAVEVDSCAALEGVDLAMLLGEPVGEVQTGSTCRVSAESAMSAASIVVSVYPTGGEHSMRMQRDLLDVTSEPDLGDEAFLADTALAKGLDIRVADQHVSLRVHQQVDGPISDDEFVAVGETVLANLGW